MINYTTLGFSVYMFTSQPRREIGYYDGRFNLYHPNNLSYIHQLCYVESTAYYRKEFIEITIAGLLL